MLLSAMRSKARTNTDVPTAMHPPPPSAAKKQRSIHDFFSLDVVRETPQRKRDSLDTKPMNVEEEEVQKRIDYDSSSSAMDEESSEDNMISQRSDAETRTFGRGHPQPKKIDFTPYSSQHSEPDIEPSDANGGRFGLPPTSQGSFRDHFSTGNYSQAYNSQMYSQDEMDFLTPLDQPVMHLSHPTTPSPLKKRVRRSDSVELIREEAVQHITQDMTHMEVRQRIGAPPPSFSSDSMPSPTSSMQMVPPTPQKIESKPPAAAIFNRGVKRANPVSDNIASFTSFDSFVNPFAPLPPSDSGRKKRPHRKRRSFPLTLRNGVTTAPVSKYLTEFVEQELIGSGSFSKVYKCLKKIDGWTYAVKKSKRHFRGKADTERALREVQGLAALSGSHHIVRYFDAWIEDDLLYIQLEHCSGCSLAGFVDRYKPHHIPEATLCKVLCHIAQGLHDMHSKKIVHMDVKLQNVLVGPGEVYKLGDLGTVVHMDGSMEITEGDNRYLSRELLEGNRNHLRAGDIFALGATIYELARGTTLPNGGEEWQQIRDGDLMMFRQYSNSLQHLIANMMHPDPLQRPSAEEILQHEVVLPFR